MSPVVEEAALAGEAALGEDVPLAEEVVPLAGALSLATVAVVAGAAAKLDDDVGLVVLVCEGSTPEAAVAAAGAVTEADEVPLRVVLAAEALLPLSPPPPPPPPPPHAASSTLAATAAANAAEPRGKGIRKKRKARVRMCTKIVMSKRATGWSDFLSTK
ncbi:hypothetical protein AWB83_02671 [Caballeronia ptereochthonis]|uniref:Uncharacterized protein n=1 Tax=Caballeronia ptereochthonis TaxID=1777144 RepID=A0A158B2N0_9BURK|nr:hypothetical protein AWB83_02671 [Caballeronia ptereochthonis]